MSDERPLESEVEEALGWHLVKQWARAKPWHFNVVCRELLWLRKHRADAKEPR